MMNSTPRSLLLLVKVSLILTLIVIVLGAYTRLSDAGLGCPDWPGCYGKLVVPSGESAVANANLEYPERALEADKAWIEMVHRYFAGSLGLLIFAIAAWSVSKRVTPIGLPLLIVATVIFSGAAWDVDSNTEIDASRRNGTFDGRLHASVIAELAVLPFEQDRAGFCAI